MLSTYEYPIRSVEKTTRILDAVAESQEGTSLHDLARRIEMSKGTLHRFLSTLRSTGYIKQDTVTKRYFLGVRFLHLSQSFIQQDALLATSRPLMRRLMQECGETVTLAVLEGTEVRYMDAQESTDPLRYSVRAGGHAPAHSTALGKVLLAGLDDGEIQRRYARRQLHRYTHNTTTSLAALMREIAGVRREGWASDDEEYVKGIRCLAVPIRDGPGRTIAGLSVSGPAFRFTETSAQAFRAFLDQASAEIGRAGSGDARRPGLQSKARSR